MKNIISEYGKTIIYFLVAFSFIGFLSIALDKNKEIIKDESIKVVGNNEVLKQTNKPTFDCKTNKVTKGTYFNPQSYVHAKDGSGKDITKEMEVFGNIDTGQKGSYDIRYTVRDQYGIFSAATFTFIVD